MAKDIKPRAERNRTLTVSDREIPLLEKCISSLDDLRLEFRDNMIINADIFDALDNIPDEYFDMIIIDPPYNLDKDFFIDSLEVLARRTIEMCGKNVKEEYRVKDTVV